MAAHYLNKRQVPPVAAFAHAHAQFFYVTATLGAIPTAMFLFVMYTKYGACETRIEQQGGKGSV